jgi:4'-phosphopantetheinyl transferase
MKNFHLSRDFFMQSIGTPLGIITGKVDIWFSDVDRPAPEIEDLKALLSPEESARAQRFRFLRDRNRYIVQHGVLRLLLAGYTGCGLRQVDLQTGANGKPYLVKTKGMDVMYFNASRSDAFVAFAFSQIGSIGVDIEKIRDIPDMLEIVEKHFTTSEKHEIFSCSDSLRSILFYKFWTRKEAVLKAQGDGLLRPLDCVDVTMNSKMQSPWKVQLTGEPVLEPFWVVDVDGPAGFAVAVATAGTISEISVRNFDFL